MQYQLRNWYFFTWLSGDHIAEQHIHNIDVCNWLMNAPSRRRPGAWAGGKSARASNGARFSTTISSSSPTPTGRRCSASAGRFPAVGTASANTLLGGRVGGHHASPYVQPRRATSRAAADARQAAGQEPQPGARESVPGRARRPVRRHPQPIAQRGGRRGHQHHDGHSRPDGDLLREKLVKWDAAFNSQLSLRPERIAWDAKPRDLPDKDGSYPVAMPGLTVAF